VDAPKVVGYERSTERAFSLRSSVWPHVTKKRPEIIKAVPIRLDPQCSTPNSNLDMVHERVKASEQREKG